MLPEVKKYIKFLIPSLIIAFSLSYAFAATLQLHKIGALDLGGKTYKEWWYTGTKPTFVGVASPSTTVGIKITDNSYTANADSNGNWSYPTALDKGDYTITISQGSESLAFTLHLGQDVPENIGTTAQTSGSASAVPTTGFNQYVAVTFGIGVILLATYFYFSTDSKKKTIFENRMIKED